METTRTLQKDWILTQDAFDRLLAALDPDRSMGGEKYEILRLKLIKFFEWQNALTPEDLADETINRVARKNCDDQPIVNLNSYIYGTARHLASEDRKSRRQVEKAAKEFSSELENFEFGDQREQRLSCCDSCLSSLPTVDRELVIKYYAADKNGKAETHRRLAEGSGVSINSLRIRVHRIKLRLHKCIEECESRNAWN